MSELRSIRAHLGLSQKDMGERLGLHQSSVSRMENGDLAIDRRTSLALETLRREHVDGQPSGADSVMAPASKQEAA